MKQNIIYNFHFLVFLGMTLLLTPPKNILTIETEKVSEMKIAEKNKTWRRRTLPTCCTVRYYLSIRTTTILIERAA